MQHTFTVFSKISPKAVCDRCRLEGRKATQTSSLNHKLSVVSEKAEASTSLLHHSTPWYLLPCCIPLSLHVVPDRRHYAAMPSGWLSSWKRFQLKLVFSSKSTKWILHVTLLLLKRCPLNNWDLFGPKLLFVQGVNNIMFVTLQTLQKILCSFNEFVKEV